MMARLGSKSCLPQHLAAAGNTCQIEERRGCLLGSDAVKHSTGGLSDAYGSLAICVCQGCTNRPCTRKKALSGWVCAIGVRRQKSAAGVADEVVESLGKFRVVYGGIQAAQDSAYTRIFSERSERERFQRIVGRILRCKVCQMLKAPQ